MSALQLAEAGLLPAIDDALRISGTDPKGLCVEITETTLLHETPTARANLEGLHERGIGIAIDDFGTGYAPLTYLNTYPIDVVKIDRSFVSGTPRGDNRLVPGIIAFAASLGIRHRGGGGNPGASLLPPRSRVPLRTGLALLEGPSGRPDRATAVPHLPTSTRLSSSRARVDPPQTGIGS